MRERIAGRWSETVWWDHAAAALLLAAHLAVIRLAGAGDWLSWAGAEQRTSVYGTAAGVVSAVGGLSAIAISIHVAAGGPRARAVRRLYPGELRRNWRALLAGTALICLACLAAQSLDGPGDPHAARFVFEYAMALAAARFLRLLWLFDALMRLNDTDASDPPAEQPLVMDPDWRRNRRDSSA